MSISSSELHFVKTNIHFGTDRFYNIFTLGIGGYYGPGLLSAGFGLGSRIYNKNKNSIHLEICHESILYQSESDIFQNGLLSSSLHYSREIFPNWYIFGGPGINFLFNNELNSDPGSARIAPYNLFNEDLNPLRVKGWIGGSLGIRFEWSK